MPVNRVQFGESLLNSKSITPVEQNNKNKNNNNSQASVEATETEQPKQIEETQPQELNVADEPEKESHTVRNTVIGVLGGVAILTYLGLQGRKGKFGPKIQKILRGTEKDKIKGETPQKPKDPTARKPEEQTTPDKTSAGQESSTVGETVSATGNNLTKAEMEAIDKILDLSLPKIEEEMLSVKAPTMEELKSMGFDLSKFEMRGKPNKTIKVKHGEQEYSVQYGSDGSISSIAQQKGYYSPRVTLNDGKITSLNTASPDGVSTIYYYKPDGSLNCIVRDHGDNTYAYDENGLLERLKVYKDGKIIKDIDYVHGTNNPSRAIFCSSEPQVQKILMYEGKEYPVKEIYVKDGKEFEITPEQRGNVTTQKETNRNASEDVGSHVENEASDKPVTGSTQTVTKLTDEMIAEFEAGLDKSMPKDNEWHIDFPDLVAKNRLSAALSIKSVFPPKASPYSQKIIFSSKGDKFVANYDHDGCLSVITGPNFVGQTRRLRNGRISLSEVIVQRENKLYKYVDGDLCEFRVLDDSGKCIKYCTFADSNSKTFEYIVYGDPASTSYIERFPKSFSGKIEYSERNEDLIEEYIIDGVPSGNRWRIPVMSKAQVQTESELRHIVKTRISEIEKQYAADLLEYQSLYRQVNCFGKSKRAGFKSLLKNKNYEVILDECSDDLIVLKQKNGNKILKCQLDEFDRFKISVDSVDGGFRWAGIYEVNFDGASMINLSGGLLRAEKDNYLHFILNGGKPFLTCCKGSHTHKDNILSFSVDSIAAPGFQELSVPRYKISYKDATGKEDDCILYRDIPGTSM